jgi:hypothetical protein
LLRLSSANSPNSAFGGFDRLLQQRVLHSTWMDEVDAPSRSRNTAQLYTRLWPSASMGELALWDEVQARAHEGPASEV